MVTGCWHLGGEPPPPGRGPGPEDPARLTERSPKDLALRRAGGLLRLASLRLRLTLGFS